MITILINVPFWVLPLFLGLVWLGLKATQDRCARPVGIFLMPLMGLITLNRALGLPEAEIAVTGLACAYVIGVFVGFRVQGRWIRNGSFEQGRWIENRDGDRVLLKGEWLTLVTVLSIFSVSFAAGMLDGMGSPVVQTGAFAVTFGLVAGGFSGSLLGRALRVAIAPTVRLA